ncbi:hypothetical protein KY284_010922 [Solanum tuberosum]|nr:hypothetical protein KY284_010922 [Solanum tuberosum]
MLMENFLRSKDYLQVVVDGIQEPAEGTAVSDAQKADAHLGLHEEEISRIDEGKEEAASSTSFRVRNSSNEIWRVNSVKFRSNFKAAAIGKGQVLIQTSRDYSHTITDVLFVPDLKTNLLSIGQLQEKGTLHQKNMVNGLPHITAPSETCENCGVSKQPRYPFSQGKSWRAKALLELVHSDLCGPINQNSNGGKRYFITFIDDFSRKTWVYFLHEKSAAFDVFKRFKVLVEKEMGSPLKSLRIDRGREFNSQEFIIFCEENVIKRQLTLARVHSKGAVKLSKVKAYIIWISNDEILIVAALFKKEFHPALLEIEFQEVEELVDFLVAFPTLFPPNYLKHEIGNDLSHLFSVRPAYLEVPIP